MGMLTIEWTVLIGVICTALAATISTVSHKRSVRKEAIAEGRNNGTILTEMGYIKAGIDDIKRKQAEQEKEYVEIKVMLAQTDAKSNAAHSRLDLLERRFNSLGG